MDKYDLKEKLVHLHETIDAKLRDLMYSECDEETGEIRDRIYIRLSNELYKLEEEIYNIY
jgi:hypothetical protein